MKAQWFLIAAAAIIVGSAAQSQPEPAAASRYGRIILTVATDPKVLAMPSDEEQVKELLLRNDIVAAAGQDVFGEYRPGWFEGTKLLEKPKDVGGLQITRLELTVWLDEQYKPAAREFVQAYVQRLSGVLADQHAKQMTFYNARQAEHADRGLKAELQFRELMEQQSALPAGTLDTESQRRRMQEQNRALAEIAMEQAALKSRVEELSAYINSVQSQPAPVSQDASSQELREQLSQLQARLEQQEDEDHAFDAPVLGARIADAKILLAHRKSQLQDQAAEEARQLNQERREAVMQLEELAAKERALAAAVPGSLEQSTQYEILDVKIQAAREALHNALTEADKFNSEMALIQKPAVHYSEVAFGMTRPANGAP